MGQNVGMTIKPLGLKGNQWGQIAISNIGTLGIECGFAPICPPLHAEITACVGKVMKKPVVRDD